MVTSEHDSSEGHERGCSQSLGALVHESVFVDPLDNSVVTVACGKVSIVLPPGLELSKLSRRNCNGLLNDSPFDAFPARRGGERAVVLPVAGEVEILKEVRYVEVANLSGAVGGVMRRLVERTHLHSFKERGVISSVICLEENTDNGPVLDGVVFGFVLVDHVQLHIVMLSVDGVLRGSVHVELEGFKFGMSAVVEVDVELSVGSSFSGGLDLDSCATMGHPDTGGAVVTVAGTLDFHLTASLDGMHVGGTV